VELAIDRQYPTAISTHAVDFDNDPQRDGTFFIVSGGSLEANGEFFPIGIGNNG
jgi:hypothetical protein